MHSNLNRFLEAQTEIFVQAMAEIKTGKKRSHWMWYIFPQILGLGLSETSRYYAIQHLEEAKEYLHHPILGSRLKLITKELIKLNAHDARSIFGTPDDLKLKSSMTLFDYVDESDEKLFRQLLKQYFNGEQDSKTLEFINCKNTSERGNTDT